MKLARNRLISIILIVLLVFSSTASVFADSEDAGDKEDQKKQEEQLKAKKEAEKKAAEEKARKAAEEKAKKEAEEKAKKEAEEKARKEAEEKAKKEAEEKARKEAEKEAAEKAKKEEEAKAAENEKQEDDKKDPEDKADKAENKGQEPDEQQEDKQDFDDHAGAAGSSTDEHARNKDEQEKAESGKDKLKLQDDELSDGTYKPEATFTGGSGRVVFSCDKVILKGGKAYAVITVNSDSVTHLYMGTTSSRAEDTSLYDPKTGATGEDVYPFTNRQVSVPAEINKTVDFSGRTNAMSSENRWISYTYNFTVKDESQKISDDTTVPENGESKPEEGGDDPEDPDKPDDPDDPDDDKKSKGLKDGTYKVKATTCRVMFYLYPKEKNPATAILVKKNGKMTATITLTGTGYDYVYMGTPAQAKKAGKKKWIKYKKVNGYYTFTIPVSKLDKKLKITPHSKKYEEDGDPSTDPWRPDKWIKFYSKGAKKVKDGTTIKTKGKPKDRNSGNNSNNNKKWKDDSNKGTSAVNNSTGLKDGTYKPDRFNWSGGSGRLAYIRCNKITVKGGKAYATIEFSSSKYDSLRASGHVYHKQGGGNSRFTIPVKLNANNTIVGRTTAMSQPHWIQYRIFIYKKGANAGKKGSNTEEGDDGHMTSTKKLSSSAPDLMGLDFVEEVEVKYAKYFKIYKYEQGITLIEVDQASGTGLYKDEKKDKKESTGSGEGEEAESTSSGDEAGDDAGAGTGDDAESGSEDGSQGHVEYDEDGNPVAQSQNEVVDGLYQNNVVNYIVVPEGVEIPAGLDKDGIILQQPVDKSFVASPEAAAALEQLGLLDKMKAAGFDPEEDGSDALKKALDDESMTAAGTADKPDYSVLVKEKVDLGIFPSAILPEKLDEEPASDEEEEAEEKTQNLGVLRKRFSALGIPMIIDRSKDEKTNYGTAEWIKVYGAVFGKEAEAAKIVDDYIAENKEEKNEQ